MTTYANEFKITCSALTQVEFVQGEIAISSGSWNTSVTQSGATWTVTMNSGRSGSTTLANDYVSQVQSQYNMFVQQNYSGDAGQSNNVPTSMNFYFALNLGFSGHGGRVWVGQGGLDLTNFWWIGGPMILNSCPNASPLAYVVTPLGLYQASFINNSVYWLEMTPAV